MNTKYMNVHFFMSLIKNHIQSLFIIIELIITYVEKENIPSKLSFAILSTNKLMEKIVI